MTDVDLSELRWVKSTYSNNGGDCVEVAPAGLPGRLPVRDSKDPQGPVLVFPEAAFTAFVAAVKSGAFEELS
ncbi:uncharacterized protein DUF397 [Kitasatospora sp. SolWspMP-SS2h]|uniref:DUF397 domain-containing protein n=1 Tax=Kitasatospora sp. SolWspMP-SS2h TaxID=1305729 RepID=UPI000DB9FBC4|nr:DUF397 domain-containing protein [Kitasatospora sp. SolWspMP-SS2h]RAJ40495.1 uncharacterized protein DUF397 [Kitasatospora sp. SolWspMP-SS2h]